MARTPLAVSTASKITRIRTLEHLVEFGLYGVRALNQSGQEHHGRRRLLKLTRAGAKLVRRLQPVWRALDEAAIELEAEAGDVLAALDRLERALARHSIYERAKERLG